MKEESGTHEKVLGRINSLSDGIFAFAITLLILNVAVPEGTVKADLPAALAALWPKYLAFLISFFVIGLYWFTHVRQFRSIKKYDTRLLWLNLIFLLFIVTIPFSTSVMSSYQAVLSVIVYAALMACAGFMSVAIWAYATHNHKLVNEELGQAAIRRGIIITLISPIVFTLSIGIAFVNVELAQYSWISIFIVRMLLTYIFRLPKADDDI